MKKILINIILILGSFALKAQYPLTQNLGSSSTLVQVPANGGIIGGVILRVFTDTTAANLTNLKYYDGALIKTTSPIEAIWWRDLSSMLWIQLLPSGGGTGASGWTLGGNILIPRSDSSVLGSIDNTDWYLISNNQKFLKLNRAGIQANSGSVVNLGVNMSTGDLSFGSSGSTPTWQQTLTAGSTLTGNNSVQNSGNYVFEMFNNGRSAIRFNNSTSITYLGDIDNTVYGDKLVIDASSSLSYIDNVDHDIRVGINNTSPTAYLHLAAGTAAAQTAPLKFTSGTNLTTPEAGAMEWNGTNLFITQTSGPTRKTIAYTSDIPSGLTVGTTTIAAGTTTRILYDNAGVLGEYTLTGTGTAVAMQTSPSFVTSVIGGASFDVFNTTSTTINAFGAATTLNIAANASGAAISLGGSTNAIELRFKEGSGGGSNYVGFKANATLAGNTIYTLPTAFPAGTYLVNSTSAGVMGFTDPSTFLTGLTVGTTTIASGTNTRILYDNSGVLGEYTLTGTGTVVAMQTAPTFITSITSPLIIGGTGTTSTLTYKTTTGVGAVGADHIWLVGNNGATEAMRILNSGNVGIGTATPNSTLHVSGSLALKYLLVEENEYNITEFDYTLSVNNVGNDWTIILPDASTCTGRIYIIKRYDNNSTGLVTVDANSCDVQSPATGSFNTTFDLTAWGTQNQSVMFQSNGTNWEAIK